jgi:hypothetical protein
MVDGRSVKKLILVEFVKLVFRHAGTVLVKVSKKVFS